MKNATKLYEKMLKLKSPWKVEDVEFDESNERLKVFVVYHEDEGPCPETGEICKIYDRRDKTWRHLDSMDYETWIVCRLPRIKNSFGKLHDIPTDWSEPNHSHTMKFENKCIETFQATHCQSSAARLMRISPDKICGVMHRAVMRGLERRDLTKQPVLSISIDEKSYGKGQRYISVLTNADNGAVLDIEPDRDGKAACALLQKVFTEEQLQAIKRTCCDLSKSYIGALKKTALMLRLFSTSFTS